MYVVSVNLPERVGISVSEGPVGIPAPEKSPNQLAGYSEFMPKSGAVWDVSTQSRKTSETKSGRVRN